MTAGFLPCLEMLRSPQSHSPYSSHLRSPGKSLRGSLSTPPIAPKRCTASPSLAVTFVPAAPFSSSDASLAGSRIGTSFWLYAPSCRPSLTSDRVYGRSRYLPMNSPPIPCFEYSLTSLRSNSQRSGALAEDVLPCFCSLRQISNPQTSTRPS